MSTPGRAASSAGPVVEPVDFHAGDLLGPVEVVLHPFAGTLMVPEGEPGMLWSLSGWVRCCRTGPGGIFRAEEGGRRGSDHGRLSSLQERHCPAGKTRRREYGNRVNRSRRGSLLLFIGGARRFDVCVFGKDLGNGDSSQVVMSRWEILFTNGPRIRSLVQALSARVGSPAGSGKRCFVTWKLPVVWPILGGRNRNGRRQNEHSYIN